MKIVELLKKYTMNEMAIDFNSLYNIAKIKGYYTNKKDFEIDLERAMDECLIACQLIKNENRFYIVK